MNTMKQTSVAHLKCVSMLKRAGIKILIFTSSILVYGPGEDQKTGKKPNYSHILLWILENDSREALHKEWLNKNSAINVSDSEACSGIWAWRRG
ncbi:hypothetical protein ACOBV8_16000 [Pseudoalteromonas espejiana]